MDKKLLELIDKTDFKSLFNKLNYVFFTKGDYNLNIIGVRNLLNGPVTDNTFNDALVVLYKVNGKWEKYVWQFTTDPGITSLTKPVNSNGCAILKPGQYRNVYKLDYHKNKYIALCQRLGPVTVYRDNNKNNILDFIHTKTETGYFGVNIHKAGTDSIYVNSWSAGCQVFKKENNFNTFITLCRRAEKIYGNRFTYTLLITDELINNLN